MESIGTKAHENVGNSGRGRSQEFPKMFRASICRAHCAVIFAIAQLSCLYRPSIVTFPLSLRVSEILPLLFSSIPLFPYHTPIRAKIWGCSLWSRSVTSGSADRRKVSLINREIIFQEFQSV